MNLIIHYQKVQDFNLVGYSDSDWGGSCEIESISGYVFYLGLGAVV